MDWRGNHEQSIGNWKWKGVTAYTAFLITLIFVPVASVAHWSTTFNKEDSKNTIVAWLSAYPMMSLMNSLYVFGLVEGVERKVFLIEWLNEQMAILEQDREDHAAKFDPKTICNEKLGSRREPKRGNEEEHKNVESASSLPEYICCMRTKT